MSQLSEDAKSFISGLVSGWFQVIVMQPFEIVKVRQTNQPYLSKKYNGFIRSLKTIISQQGLLALYKGTKSPLIGYGFLCSLQFGFNRFFRKLVASFNGGLENTTTLIIAGVLTGIPSAIVITPTDHLRILMQKQAHGDKQQYKGQFAAAKDITKRHSIRGLYLGFKSTFLRQMLALAIYFTCIQEIKILMNYDYSDRNSFQKIKVATAGCISGLISWILAYPIDFVKTRMQSQDLDHQIYRNNTHCFRACLAEYGWRGFTRGLWTVCLRSIPVNMVGVTIQQQVSFVLGRQILDRQGSSMQKYLL